MKVTTSSTRAAQVTFCLLRYCSSRGSSDSLGSSFAKNSMLISATSSGFSNILTDRTDYTSFIKTTGPLEHQDELFFSFNLLSLKRSVLLSKLSATFLQPAALLISQPDEQKFAFSFVLIIPHNKIRTDRFG